MRGSLIWLLFLLKKSLYNAPGCVAEGSGSSGASRLLAAFARRARGLPVRVLSTSVSFFSAPARGQEPVGQRLGESLANFASSDSAYPGEGDHCQHNTIPKVIPGFGDEWNKWSVPLRCRNSPFRVARLLQSSSRSSLPPS